MYVCICMYVCMYVCMYNVYIVYLYVYMVYLYVFICDVFVCRPTYPCRQAKWTKHRFDFADFTQAV